MNTREDSAPSKGENICPVHSAIATYNYHYIKNHQHQMNSEAIYTAVASGGAVTSQLSSEAD